MTQISRERRAELRGRIEPGTSSRITTGTDPTRAEINRLCDYADERDEAVELLRECRERLVGKEPLEQEIDALLRRVGGTMTKLRRCSPEIERELHDKEARIRELEAALRDVDGGLLYYVIGIPHLDTPAKMHRLRIKHLLSAAPPDSEPAGFDGEEENMRAQRLSDADGGQRYE